MSHEDIPLTRPTADTHRIHISFHPVYHFAEALGCVPPLTDVDDSPPSLLSKPRCGSITPDSLEVLPLLKPIWLAQSSEAHYMLIQGYGTYGTYLHQNAPTLYATILTPPTVRSKRRKKLTTTIGHDVLETATLYALIDIFLIGSLYPNLFDKKARCQLIFWLETLGLLSLLLAEDGKGSRKRAALQRADLPESTYNLHTRTLRQRCIRPSQPTPDSHQDHPQGNEEPPSVSISSLTSCADMQQPEKHILSDTEAGAGTDSVTAPDAFASGHQEKSPTRQWTPPI